MRNGAALVVAVIVLMAVASMTGNPSESGDGTFGATAADEPSDAAQPDVNALNGKGWEENIGNTDGGASDIQNPAQVLLEDMTLEEKVNQMFLIRFPERDAAETVRKFKPGGFLLFARDFRDRTPEALKELLSSCQNASGAIPLLLGVDEEGGTVNRVSRYSQYCDHPFGSPQEVFKQGGMENVAKDTRAKSEFLLDLGLNLNLAPVCDVSIDPSDFMYSRTLGQNAEAVADYVSAVVEAANRAGIGSTLKHFPGYGNNADTHTGSARDMREYETFLKEDFLPFQAGIAAGAGSVLICHNVVECMDSQNPASLSPEVHRILREELEFEGVMITDDLIMEAVTDFAGSEEAAVLAVEAGNDLLISSDYETQMKAVLKAVLEGRLKEERINEAVLRILLWKMKLGLIS